MDFYYENNQCIIGELILPKGSITVKYKESDTEVEILKAGTELGSALRYFDGLITDLDNKAGIAYADKAALDAVLSDFFI